MSTVHSSCSKSIGYESMIYNFNNLFMCALDCGMHATIHELLVSHSYILFGGCGHGYMRLHVCHIQVCKSKKMASCW